MSNPKRIRRGGTIVILLVVVLIVGLLMQQTIQSFSVLRRGQDQQARIDQANQLLELGMDLDQQGAHSTDLNPGLPWIVPIGTEFGRLEVVDVEAESGARQIWVAKVPVNANGLELPNKVATKVSCERLR